MRQNNRDSSRNSDTSPLAWAPDLCQALLQSQTPWNTPWHPHWKRNRSKKKQTVFHSQFSAGKPGAQTPIQALGTCALWKKSLISTSHGSTIPLHMTLDIARKGNALTQCLSHFPIVWECWDSHRRYPVLLRLQCRMKYPNIWVNSDGKFP